MSCNPEYDATLPEQKNLSHISDEEIIASHNGYPSKWYHILYQVVCFIVFLGPIRLILSLIIIVDTLLFIASVRLTLNFLGFPEAGKQFLVSIGRISLRLFLFTCGVMYIDVQGKIDYDARFVISNHVGFPDFCLAFLVRNLSVVLKKEFGDVPMIRPVIDNVNPIYVDRSASCGQSQLVINQANDPAKNPVLIFPEGTICSGDFLLKFHRSAFLTNKKVQPMIMKYNMPLVPKRWNSFHWTEISFIQYYWQLMSMPPSYATIELVPSITLDNEGKGDIEYFAKYAQLLFANKLKIKAIDGSSDIIFKNKKEEKIRLSQQFEVKKKVPQPVSNFPKHLKEM